MSKCTTLHNQIAKLFLEKLNLEVPSIETDLVDAGLLDSLMFMDLLLYLEQDFGVEITIDGLEVDNFRSIAKIADFATNQGGAKEAMSP